MTHDEIKSRKQGYKTALEDISLYGLEYCKHKFAIRLKCTGCDPSWTVGYGEAIVYACAKEGKDK